MNARGKKGMETMVRFALISLLLMAFFLLGCGCADDDNDEDGAGNDDDSSDDDTGDDDDDDDDTGCTDCEIDGDCYADGDTHPENPCLVCDISRSTSEWSLNDGASCDEGLACTDNVCDAGRCVTSPVTDCAWPAESSLMAENLTGIEGFLTNDFHRDLSGAAWDPTARKLWLCRNNGPSKLWVVVEDGNGGYQIDYKGGNRGEWTDFGDLEGLTIADPAEPETLYLIVEGQGHIKEYDLSTYGVAVLINDWNAAPFMPGGDGAEGITFVPNAFLEDQGFVDEAGAPYLSTQGMDGLMFVGHQYDGRLYIFDLNRDTGSLVFIGKYLTGRDETAGLEFDLSTGLLFILHGADHNVLEVTKLSSTLQGSDRHLDTVKVFIGPAPVPFGSTNYEGIAVVSNEDCLNGERGFFLTIDGGGFWSLLLFNHFPCERPTDLWGMEP